ncbi:MAG: hypothetical protein ACO272_01335 [Candidatus Fonsibacter ubiquis]
MYFLSFYSEGEPYDEGFSLSAVAEEIKEKLTSYFDDIFLYNKRSLKTLPNSEDICNSYDEPLDQNANVHHFGYFDFKPFLIDYTLKNIPENSLLLYHDGNFIKNQQYWQTDWENLNSICENMLSENSSDIWFQMEREGCYVKSCVKEYTLDYFFTESEKHVVKNSHLINAARVLVRNNKFGRKFISEYLELCKNKNLIAKNPNHNPDPEFQWSCGDQDVLNCLVYRYILDGKLPKTFPRFSFLYRVLRYENRPFLWSGVNNDNYHFTGISELRNTELLTYMENLSVEINENDIVSFLNLDKLSEETDLCKILKKYGSDKSSDWHNYSPLYNYFFQHLKDDEINFFEVGIYHGASVHSWREYFSKAKIFTADVDEKTFLKVEDLDVECFYCDQDDPITIKTMWNTDKLKDIHFDVILDDGKHEFISNLNFLKESIHKLKKGGIFIIEDLTISTCNSFENILFGLQNQYSLDYIKLLKLPSQNNKIDNNILLIIK